MPPPTLLILYNATSTLLGKLTYTYRKITAPKCAPACAACDITHGGLHLDETAAWKEAKAEIGDGGRGLLVKQLHKDEVGGEVKRFIEEKGLGWPMVLEEDGEGGGLKVVMDSEELAGCGGDVKVFVGKLREKGVLGDIS